MVPVSSIIIFFQVGAVNNGRNWASIGIMGSEWGMDFLLSKMSFVQLLSYPKRGFMPYSFPKLYKSPCPCGTPPPMKMSWRWAILFPRSDCAEVGARFGATSPLQI